MPGDFVTALLAESILQKEQGGSVIYDVRASRAVPETIERAGGTALINRVGHAYIKHRMRKEDAVFGGEVSAHYYFRDFSQADSGVVPFLLLLELISRSGRKLSEILAPYREQFFLTGEINTPVADVPLEAAGAEGALRRRHRHPSRRDLGRLRRLALQRAPLEHRAAPAPQPGGVLAGADGAEAGRGARPDPLVTTIELGRVTDRKPPFKYSAIARVWFSDTDAQGIVYYGRYLPYFDHARTEYHRHLGRAGLEGREFVMRASSVEYHAPARFDELLEIFVRTARIGRTSTTYECAAYRMEDDELMVTATQTLVLVDLEERRPAEIPDEYRSLIRSFEGEDLEA